MSEDERERDRALDAAWRSASREEPPAVLDAAIRAAARREVGARPVRAHATRWWVPLATAAAVAIITVAIVQLAPPEQVTPTTATDVPKAAPPEAKREAAADAVSDAKKAAAPATPSPIEAAPQKPDSAAKAAPAGRLGVLEPAPQPAPQYAAPPVAAPSNQAGKPMPAERGARSDEGAAVEPSAPAAPAVPARQRDQFAAAKSLAPPPEAAQSQAPAAAGVVRSEPEPFPAAVSGGAAPVASELDHAERKSVAAQTMNNAPAPAPASVANETARVVQPSVLAKVAAGSDARAKDAARTPEEWIVLIRRLKAEGKTEEAAKELAAFRAAYKDRADALLPPDLRATKP